MFDGNAKPLIPETVEDLIGISSEPEATLEQLVRKAGLASPAHYVVNPWTTTAPEPPRDNGDDLHKGIDGPRPRHQQTLRAYIRKMLALGETVESLVAHARQHDETTANDLLEASAGL